MKIACLSGKGGAGKTFVSVNLAVVAGKCTYIDCDVEEPNGRLFLKPENIKYEIVNTLLPDFDATKCNGCKKCVEYCRFHALMYIKDKPVVFSEVCHSCGLCKMVCKEDAISTKAKEVGIVEVGKHKNITVVTGILNVGEASGIPVIKQALNHTEEITILDCPPGSACSVMESIMKVDYCVLVVEPTAFGFHNFKMVYELCRLLKKPLGVVINKESEPFKELEEFCTLNNITILARIPYTKDLAKRISDNEIVSEKVKTERERFSAILSHIGGSI